MRSSRLLALLLSLSFARVAFADDDPHRRAQAEARFKEGLALHEQGNDTEARLRFEQAYAVLGNANILFNLARSEQLTGDEVLAAGHYRACLKDPHLLEKPRGLAKKFLDELDQKLAHIQVVVPEGATVLVDDSPITSGPGEAIYVRSGPHRVAASLGKVSQHVDGVATVAGNVTTVTMLQDLRIVATSDAPAGQVPPPAPSLPVAPAVGAGRDAPAQESPLEPATKAIVAASLGVLGVGLVVAGALEFKASGDQESTREQLASQNPYCTVPSTGCAALNTAAQATDNDHNLGVGLVAGGGIALAGGVAAWFLWPKHDSRRQGWMVSPEITAHTAGLRWSGSF